MILLECLQSKLIEDIEVCTIGYNAYEAFCHIIPSFSYQDYFLIRIRS